MSCEESSSSSDESNSSRLEDRVKGDPHLTCNHRLISRSDPNSFEDSSEDSLPLIDNLTINRKKPRSEEKLLLCKAFTAIVFLMVTLLLLFYLFFNHIVINADRANGDRFSLGSNLTSEKPSYQIFLDSHNRYNLYWSLDYDSETILFELKLKLLKDNDWFVFGFSDYGSVSNADLCAIWFDRKRRLYFEDAKTNNESVVTLSSDTNHCQFIKAKQIRKKNILYLAFSRLFDTCDPKSYRIDNGTTHLVYGTGQQSGTFGLDNVRLFDTEHGFQRVQLLKPQLYSSKSSDSNRSYDELIDFLVENVTVPSVDTTYWCSLHRLPDKFKSKHHITQYEAIVSESSKHLVHHMELFHCEIEPELSLSSWNGSCDDVTMPKPLKACKKVVAAWAFGAAPMIYPEQVGFPIGGSNQSLYLMIEIHYNNPEFQSGRVDNSGIRIHYTSELRHYDAGILEIGVEYTDKNSIPPKTLMDIRGYCVSECTRIGLPPDGIVVFASQLHTHLTGIKTWTEHIRAGERIGEINRDDHYSPHFQEIRKLEAPVRIHPGDSLIHVCRYDTSSRDKMTLGGFSIQDEMCVNYIHYYPRSDLEVCKSSIDSKSLGEYFDRLRSTENQNTSSKYSVADNYRSIEWNPKRIEQLNQLYQTSPLSVQCNRSSGVRFPVSYTDRCNYSNRFNDANR
ncbi:dopamine beta-hydroxylase-like protein [Sarcoptes scabiei]|uniref:Dopamine beta-hydroxylase-like protein n=1 Tax=Sarcoptes scabiei TaxID=52283 RepID=A0A132A2H1_SARSC|nr:dopamine beta-hydroxylase-like protein [Sarcoptes scabiei]